MADAIAELDPDDAEEGAGPAVPLCISCWTPHGPRADFCGSCGAPVSIIATSGAYETVWAWGWALGASGRWRRTRVTAMVVCWAYVFESIYFWWWCQGEDADFWPGTPHGFLSHMLLTLELLLHAALVRFATLRWWRMHDAPDPAAPDEIQPDLV